MFRRKVLLSDTVGFISELPVQVTRSTAVVFALMLFLSYKFSHVYICGIAWLSIHLWNEFGDIEITYINIFMI